MLAVHVNSSQLVSFGQSSSIVSPYKSDPDIGTLCLHRVAPHYLWMWPFLRSGDLSPALLLSLLPFQGSRQHHVPGVLIGWQVPQCGSLAGLLRVVCVVSGLCLRVATGHSGNHGHSVCHTDRNGTFALHHWWHGWVCHQCSLSCFIGPLC